MSESEGEGGAIEPVSWKAPATTEKRARKQAAFLQALRETNGHITKAARMVGVERTTTFKWRQSDPEFLAKWDDVMAETREDMEAELIRRAKDGWEEPIFFHGEQCGTVRRYSDPLLLAYMRARHPDYKERVEITDDTPPVAVNPDAMMRDMLLQLHDQLGRQKAVVEPAVDAEAIPLPEGE